MTAVERQEIKSIVARGETITGVFKNDSKFTAVTPVPNAELVEQIRKSGVEVETKSTRQPWWSGLLGLLLPVALIIGFWLFIMNRMQGGAKGAMGFGKSKAKLLTEHKGRKTFDDVAGVDEAKDELQEVVDFLKDPARCSSASAPAACATCSNRPRRTPPASSSSMRSTPSVVTVERVSAAATTSASRR